MDPQSLKPREPLTALPSHPVGPVELGLRYSWGVKFFATRQLRTPLRVLVHDGERFNGPGDPPAYARELWEGIWVPFTARWRELGVYISEFGPTTVATDIGPIVEDGSYLAFLVRIRTLIETANSVEQRRAALLDELAQPVNRDYCRRHGGAEHLARLFFPLFWTAFPGCGRTPRRRLLRSRAHGRQTS